MPDKPRVIVTGGGTGGHVYPALAIAEAISDLAEVHYVGHPDKLEGRVVPTLGLPFHPVRSAPAGGGLMGKIRLAVSLLIGVIHGIWLVLKLRPALVIGVGGYVSVPMMLAGWLCGRAMLLHEQNVAPGKANRMLARLAKIPVMTSWPDLERHFPASEVTVTGCPVRAEFTQTDRSRARAVLGLPEVAEVLLIMGGSGGAAAINRSARALLELLDRRPNLHILHATGRNYHQSFTAELAGTAWAAHPRYRVNAYIDDAPTHMAASDIMLSRSGASTLNELFCAGLASVLLPSPNVTDNHQHANAAFAERAGAAILIAEEDDFATRVVQSVEALLNDPARLRAMSDAAHHNRLGEDASAQIRTRVAEVLS